jgi:hypothetical protein
MKSDFGKAVVLIISTILYTIFRIMEFISKPMLFLDVFMLIIFFYSLFLMFVLPRIKNISK